MRFILCLVVFVLGSSATALEIVKGERASAMYLEFEEMAGSTPDNFVRYENAFLGSDQHPGYGKLWLTTIFRKGDVSTICYKYDFREVQIVEYRCEVK